MTDQLPITDEGRVLGLRLDLEQPLLMSNNQAADPGLPPVDYDKLPVSAGVAKWMKVEDQGQEGSCQGQARTSCMELAYWRQTQGSIIQYSRLYAYLSSQAVDGLVGDVGSSLTGGAQAAMKFGQALESDYPYGPYPRNGWVTVPAKVRELAKATTLSSYRVLRSYDEVMRWLVHGIGGCIIGLPITDAWESDPLKVDRYDPRARSPGGHAMAWLDWSRDHEAGGRPYIDNFNSWGQRWGTNGRKFVHPDVVDLICQRCQVLGYANVLGKDITPRPFSWLAHHHI